MTKEGADGVEEASGKEDGGLELTVSSIQHVNVCNLNRDRRENATSAQRVDRFFFTHTSHHSRLRVSQVAELHALESLASPSSVEKERAQLAMMKAALQESLGEV